MELGMSDSFQKVDSLVSSFFSGLGNSMNEVDKTISVWKEVLSSIKSNHIDNSQLIDHSKIVDFKNGILIVETDHPGRIQLFQMYKNYIQTGINRKLPALGVKNIVFKLKKDEKKEEKADIEEIIRKKLLNDTIDDIIEYNKTKKSEEVKEELPEELKAIFERMKKNLN